MAVRHHPTSSQFEQAGFRWLEKDVLPTVEPRVISAFRIHWPPHCYKDPPEQHYFWILDYYFSPGVHFRAEQPGAKWAERPVHVGHLYRPDVAFRHDMRHLRGVTHSCYISIRGGERFELEQLVPPGHSHAVFLDPGNGLGHHLLDMIELGERYRYAGFLRVQARLFDLIQLLTSATSVSPGLYRIEHDSTSTQTFVAAVRNFYDAHLHERITLPAVARALGVSVSVLAHRYKRETGETLIQSLTRLRIRKCKELLIAGRSVKEAAELTGFYDPFHLSKTFKKLEHISPRDFLRHIRKLNPAGPDI